MSIGDRDRSGGSGSSVARVRRALAELGVTADVRELPNTTRTAVEAARTVGCAVEQIAKSIVFAGRDSRRAYVVVARGADRIDEAKLAALAGEPIGKPDAAFVREATGFAIGGVPPIGHGPDVRVLVDRRLAELDSVWAAAGSPFAVVPLTPAELRESGAEVAELT
jgi:prolyl-tRNA editing enzyme YbaK/EbsC (Cys-tRNA(Pro) deacylase)